jgi:hypothetical protein
MRRLRHFLFAAAAAAQFAAATAAGADVSETAVKAAFLPRFAHYVTWPPAAMPRGNDDFILCVADNDPFGTQLDQSARTQSVDNHRIAVRRLSSAAGAGACQIIMIEGSRSVPSGDILAAVGSKPILTVTDARNGGPRGIIHFTVVGGRVRFFIDEAGAARRGLTVSSRLLALAVGVKQR